MQKDQQVIVHGTKAEQPRDDEITLVIDAKSWRGWTDITVTRSIEQCPPTFSVSLYDKFEQEFNVGPDCRPSDNRPEDQVLLAATAGDPIEVWFGPFSKPTNRVLTGYVDRVDIHIAPHGRTMTITGRGKTQDLVDCSARWKGMQIVASSVLEVARKLAEPFDIDVNGVPGPAVGSGPVFPQLNVAIGETCFSIIEQLCRVAALIPIELPDGSLYLFPSPGSQTDEKFTFAHAASEFEQGVNVQSGSMALTMDQRHSEVSAFRVSFDQYRDIGEGGNFIASFADKGVPRHRPLDIVAEAGKVASWDNAERRAAWEAGRRWARGHRLQITTDNWRDSSGALYEVNKLAHLNIPRLKVMGVAWLIVQVTFKVSAGTGTTCDLVLMPPEGLMVRPTLPNAALPADIANLRGYPQAPSPQNGFTR